MSSDFRNLTDVPSDKPETFKDAPVSVQVVGRRLEEEAVIAMSEIVDVAVKSFKSG